MSQIIQVEIETDKKKIVSYFLTDDKHTYFLNFFPNYFEMWLDDSRLFNWDSKNKKYIRLPFTFRSQLHSQVGSTHNDNLLLSNDGDDYSNGHDESAGLTTVDIDGQIWNDADDNYFRIKWFFPLILRSIIFVEFIQVVVKKFTEFL